MALEEHAGLGVETLGCRRGASQEVGDQRPATRRPGLAQPRQARPSRAPARARPEQAERREGVVRNLTRPDHVPESVQHRLLVPATGRVVEVGKEGRPPTQEVLAEALVDLGPNLALAIEWGGN